MRTFSIGTLGCKVNQYESQQIRELLEHQGLMPAEKQENADLIIINTCCVTRTASAKSRQYIRKAQRSNSSTVVVCGCLPAVNTCELNSLDKSNLHIIKNRNNLVATLSQITTCSGHHENDITSSAITIKAKNIPEIKNKTPILPQLPSLSAFRGQTRAFLKIQDGCDGFCSYCIIPKTRPVIYNKPVEQVINEAQVLVNSGHKEIVLTGIFLGSYGRDTVRRNKWANRKNDNLSDLLDKIAKIPNLERIRLSSLEPADITEKLLETFCKNPNIMPHLHLSVQSGSGKILKKMCRQYTTEDLILTIELAKNLLDKPALTCDLIVGFPGESKSDFEKTVELTERVNFSKMHIFSFSPREGTAAAKMDHQIPKQIIKERSETLRYLDKQLGFRFREQFIGSEQTILTEASNNGTISGRTERYFNVFLKRTKEIHQNQLLKVKLTANNQDGMLGQITEHK